MMLLLLYFVTFVYNLEKRTPVIGPFLHVPLSLPPHAFHHGPIYLLYIFHIMCYIQSQVITHFIFQRIVFV